MPRDILLANGTLLVGFDQSYQIRDLFYPTIGGENHAANFPFLSAAAVPEKKPDRRAARLIVR